MERAVIRLRGVSFAYGERQPVLRGVDLEIDDGLTLLVGPNGCGKSTLLKIAAGVERPDAGTVRIDDHDLWQEEILSRAELAYVPEHPDLTPYATVAEVLRLVCSLRGEAAGRARDALKRTGLAAVGGHSIRELSMGQRRRAVLAAAMIGSPHRLLLDEPLEALDRPMRDEVVCWIEDHRQAGSLVLIVTHQSEPFLHTASRALTVRDGRVVMLDPLPSDPATRLKAFSKCVEPLPMRARR